MTITDAQLIAVAIGIGIGFLLGALLFGLLYASRAREQMRRADQIQSELDHRDTLEDEREAMINVAGQRLGATFDDLANRSLQSNSSTFLRLANENLGRFQERANASLEQKEKAVSQLVGPITEALQETRAQIEAVEKERHASFGSLTEQLRAVGEAQRALQTETGNLVGALKRPEVRGQWGEITLRRIAELSGMVAHCDFFEQVHRSNEGAISRPDMIVRLPEKRSLVIDSKTPLDAYLAAFEATTDEERKLQLVRHARHVREHVRSLAAKQYWQQFESAPEFVVLFLPGDPFLSAALDVEPQILDDALRQKVIVTTPSSLMALLKTVAHGWRQVELNENATVIRDLAQSLYQRLATFSTHMVRVGQTMEQSVKAYNSAVGSLERQVMPGARKFTELGVSSKKDIPALDELDIEVRNPTVPTIDTEAIDTPDPQDDDPEADKTDTDPTS